MKWFHSKKYPIALLVIFIIIWMLTAINPKYPSDFILENVLTFIFIPLLIFTNRRFQLSSLSYTLIFVFMILHSIGAHYTYAEVPYNEWSKALIGIGINELFGFSRNHFDRLVHFGFGLLLAYPIREVFMRITYVKGFWAYYLPFDVTAAFSMLYEIIEWIVSLIFGGDLGMAYLGTQGDIWDAHKDMGLAVLGAFISMSVVAFFNYRYKKDFAQDFGKSFSVKRKRPLGEVELQIMKKKNNKIQIEKFKVKKEK